jgi:hypothetical protein
MNNLSAYFAYELVPYKKNFEEPGNRVIFYRKTPPQPATLTDKRTEEFNSFSIKGLNLFIQI